jgi:F420-dependent oxidoreductase-like protein
MEKTVFGYMASPEGYDFEEMKNICLRAEKLGFDLFTITDHFMNMINPDGPNRHPLECWTTLASLAAITHKIRLGPLVSCYYYRQPTVLAKMATTVDIISDGRLIFGVGAGWHQKEFEGFMGRFPPVAERMTGLKETIQICTSMFINERTSFSGKIYHVENVLNSPLPVQKPPPIMVGGGGEKKTLRLAAKFADMSHFAFNPSESVLERKLKVLRTHCKDVGRDFDQIKKGISVFPIVGLTKKDLEDKIRLRAKRVGVPLEEYRKRLGPVRGTTEECVGAISNYIAKGVDFFSVGFSSLEDAELFAEEIIPKFR